MAIAQMTLILPSKCSSEKKKFENFYSFCMHFLARKLVTTFVTGVLGKKIVASHLCLYIKSSVYFKSLQNIQYSFKRPSDLIND